MPRVNLEILRSPYRPALAGGFQVESCRLLTDVSLRTDAGWTPFRPAIIDTGAPLSLLPRRFWRAADVRPMGRVRVGGLTRKPECMLDVTLAVIVLAIRDPQSGFSRLKPTRCWRTPMKCRRCSACAACSPT